MNYSTERNFRKMAVLHLWSKYLKTACKGVHLLVSFWALGLQYFLRDDTHILSNFQDNYPLSIYVQNFPTALDLGRPILNDPIPHPAPSPTNYGTATAPCMWTNEINRTKPSHGTFKLTTRSIVRFNPQIMQWYH